MHIIPLKPQKNELFRPHKRSLTPFFALFFVATTACGQLNNGNSKISLQIPPSAPTSEILKTTAVDTNNMHTEVGAETKGTPQLSVKNTREAIISPAATCQGTELLPRKIWLLSADQVSNAIEDTFGATALTGFSMPNLSVNFGHANTSSTLLSDKNFLQSLFDSTEKVAENVASQNVELKSCAQNFVAPCASSFVSKYGKILWRRDLSQAEVNKLVDKSVALATQTDGLNGAKSIVQFLLTAPEFLYRSEWGTDDAKDPTKVKLAGSEIATFLAMTIWRSVPDEPLLAAANAEDLYDQALLRKQIERMIASPKAKRSVNSFFESWLQYDRIKTIPKAAEFNMTPDLRNALYKESRDFFESLIVDKKSTTKDLFTANFTYGDAQVAKWYGADQSTIMNGIFSTPKTERLGPLSHAAFIASQSKPLQTDFIHRGVFLLRQVLCKDIPPPPPGISSATGSTLTPKQGPILTRDTFVSHSANATCAGCHKLIDPVAAAFENYDAAGKFRLQENGGTIDSSGQLPDLGDLPSKFENGVSLLASIGASEHLQQCLYTNYLRYSFGFSSQEQRDKLKPGCEIANSYQKFKSGGGILKNLPQSLADFESVIFRKKEILK